MSERTLKFDQIIRYDHENEAFDAVMTLPAKAGSFS